MMGDAPSGVVARRTCPSGVASFGRATHAPRGLPSPYRAIRRSSLHLFRAVTGSPKVVPGGPRGLLPQRVLQRFAEQIIAEDGVVLAVVDVPVICSDKFLQSSSLACSFSLSTEWQRRHLREDSTGAVLGQGGSCPLCATSGAWSRQCRKTQSGFLGREGLRRWGGGAGSTAFCGADPRGCGRPCVLQRRVPAVQEVRVEGDSVLPQSVGHSSCDAETGTHNPHAPGAVLGRLLTSRCRATTGAQLLFVDKVVDVPVVQVVWFVQFLDKVVDMPVGVQRQEVVVTVQKTAEVPHLQFIDKVFTVPVDNFLSWRLWRWEEGFSQ